MIEVGPVRAIVTHKSEGPKKGLVELSNYEGKLEITRRLPKDPTP